MKMKLLTYRSLLVVYIEEYSSNTSLQLRLHPIVLFQRITWMEGFRWILLLSSSPQAYGEAFVQYEICGINELFNIFLFCFDFSVLSFLILLSLLLFLYFSSGQTNGSAAILGNHDIKKVAPYSTVSCSTCVLSFYIS